MKILDFVSDNRQIKFELVACDDWRRLRKLRLSALRQSPEAFLSSYDQEQARPEDWWRQELARGRWHIGVRRNWPARFLLRKPISLLGVTREPGMPETECFLEYLWVAERKRRSNIGYKFISEILSRLQRDGVRTVLLWVLDGNEAAVGLYRKAGFEIAGPPTPLEDRPGRTEQLWRRELPEPGLPDQIWPGIRQE